MDELGYYKAKEELTEVCKNYIDKKFETEKSLIAQYLGFAGKVALAGIGIAVLTVGFFGLKTYDDVNKSIQAEIKSRFSSDNPVAKYDALLKDAAVDGLIASLAVRVEQSERISNAEEALVFLTRALQDESVTVERKSQILDLAVRLPSSVRPVLARTARKLIQLDFKDNRESAVRLMNSLLKLYALSDANAFVADSLDIFEKYKDEATIREGVAEMLGAIEPGNGNSIVAKLAPIQGTAVPFHVKMFDLRTNPDAKLDHAWAESLVKKIVDINPVFALRAREDTIVPAEFIAALNKLKEDDESFWVLCEKFAEEARRRKMLVVYRDKEQYDRAAKPYVGLTLNSVTYPVDPKLFTTFYSKIARAFFVRSSQFAAPSHDDLLVLEFWSPRQSDDSRLTRSPNSAASAVNYRPYFLVSSTGEVRNEDDAILARERVNNIFAIRLDQESSQPRLRVYWRDALGKLNSVAASRVTGVEKSGLRVRAGTGGSDVGLGDEL
jgi:hypothetical protein